MPGQTLVHKRVIGIQHAENVSVFAHHAVEQELRLMLERLPEVVVKVGINEQVGIPIAQLAQVQPLPGKIADQRFRPRIFQHSLHLLLQYGRVS